jgi:drug/metabolite transporter (DMT)-like permease
VRWRRWTATVIGFLGVLVMVRPGQTEAELAVAIGLLGAFLAADVVVWIKKLAKTESPIAMLVYFGLFSTLIAAVPAAFVWIWPSWTELLQLALIGLLGALGQFFAIRGFRIGEATAVMPFDYSRLLFATGFGLIFFAEVPDLWTVLGAAIIVSSTLYIAHREAKLARQAAKAEE